MNWKKIMAVGLAAVSMMAFVSGCGSDTKKADTQLPKKIVIGLDDSFPPMGFKDDKGEIVGLDIDLAKEAAKRAGMDVEFKAIDWSSKEAELKSKKIDVLWNGLTVSPEREKNILFSDTYMKDKQYIVVRNDDNAIKGKSDLAGKVVGVQQASTGESALQNDPSGKTVKEIKSYADFVSAFMDLGIGRVDAVIADGVIARYLMTKEPGKYKIVEGTDYGVDNFAVEIKDNSRFIELVSADSTWLKRYDGLIFESGQGLLLDKDYTANAPHLTSSKTGITEPLSFLNKRSLSLQEAIYVTRTYVTKHGAGPLPYEFNTSDWADLETDMTNLPNEWQGDIRYASHGSTYDFLLPVTNDIKDINIKPSLAITHMNETNGKILFENESLDLKNLREIYGDKLQNIYVSRSRSGIEKYF